MPRRRADQPISLSVWFWRLQIVGAAFFLIGLVVVLVGAAKRAPLHITIGKALSIQTTGLGLVLVLVGLLLALAPVAYLLWMGGTEALALLKSTYIGMLTQARAASVQASTNTVSQLRRVATTVRSRPRTP